ncbi:hypothetical protein DPMN_005653 [Dreissena polymorpha]|uniref:Uncharacterized protein n=1 Tax=Dreissena polymorpha TaxID=45954 RepID=A0A9D4MTY0_DREPO|nr:hypothetical protein DPMN_005653 [Dreissena polymorpha]
MDTNWCHYMGLNTNWCHCTDLDTNWCHCTTVAYFWLLSRRCYFKSSTVPTANNNKLL